MPTNYKNVYGTSRAKGNFLASEVGKKLETRDFNDVVATLCTEVVEAGGKTVKVIKKGKLYPANTANAVGVVFEDVYPDADGNYVGSLMTGGYVWEDRLEDVPVSAANTSLKALGLYILKHYTVERPDFGNGELIQLAKPSVTVSSGVATWGAVSHAENYIVFVDGEFAAMTDQTSATIEGKAGQKVTVVATGDYKTYRNSELSNEVAYA